MEATCETCGNTYKNAFQITQNGETHTFDCFECAIEKLAPSCTNCGVRVIGHGMERNDQIFCSEHCVSVAA